MNLPLTILNTSVTVLAGLVLYAFYASCDPISAGEIHAGDEVHAFNIRPFSNVCQKTNNYYCLYIEFLMMSLTLKMSISCCYAT